jgi:hypothetical protein
VPGYFYLLLRVLLQVRAQRMLTRAVFTATFPNRDSVTRLFTTEYHGVVTATAPPSLRMFAETVLSISPLGPLKITFFLSVIIGLKGVSHETLRDVS